MKKCDDHVSYEPTLHPPEGEDCEVCWQMRRRVVGAIQADIERDKFREELGLSPRKNNTLIKMPFMGSGHLM